ncbi:MAG: hypothetical protein WC784_05010 [Candidatus Shapirobacteria bacterium]
MKNIEYFFIKANTFIGACSTKKPIMAIAIKRSLPWRAFLEDLISC